MNKLWCGIVVVALCLSGLRAGQASGSYKEAEGEFTIGYAVAERDAASGAVRILLAAEAPQLQDRDQHLDRLDALCEAAPGGCLIVEPTPEGDHFNVTLQLEELSYGGGGQYDSQIEISAHKASGKIDSEVLSGQLNVTFEADFLPPRKASGDLPADGGEPGAALMAQMEAIASGDRDAILRTLTEEQRDMFAQLTTEEQEQALADSAEFAPQNVKITGGVLYDGYAIVEYQAEMFGEAVTGRALLSREGDQWRVREVSNSAG
ncbi:MAG TPA: hypothetical protein VLU25_04980 [Acidobacteriota bacterium]|nr:hypothetical protein [Acidobacteriota bacterium]